MKGLATLFLAATAAQAAVAGKAHSKWWSTAPPDNVAPVIPGMPGEYSKPEPVTPETSDLLFRALARTEQYGETVNKRVCVAKAYTVEKQVVSGLNYRFHVRGATLTNNELPGKCSGRSYRTQNFTIVVWEQVWLNRLSVTEITAEKHHKHKH